ncbi:hypothetical protein ABFX02_14G076100 [Erythranthe guttata]
MDELRAVGKAYFARATDQEKELAKEFFRSLDGDSDGRVSLAEYKTLVSRPYANDTLFTGLDRNGDESLDFDEVLALHFIMTKGPLRTCHACARSMPGAYFSCIPCEKNHPDTYDLCCSCYGAGQYDHQHPAADFLDSHSMRNLLAKNFNTAGPQLRPPHDDDQEEIIIDGEPDGTSSNQNVDHTDTDEPNTDELQFHNATNKWGEEDSEASSMSSRVRGWFKGQA